MGSFSQNVLFWVKKIKLLTCLVLLILKGSSCVTFRYLLKFIHAPPTCCAQFQNPVLSLRKNSNLCSLLQAHVALVSLFLGEGEISIIVLDRKARPSFLCLWLFLCTGTACAITMVHWHDFLHVFESPSWRHQATYCNGWFSFSV